MIENEIVFGVSLDFANEIESQSVISTLIDHVASRCSPCPCPSPAVEEGLESELSCPAQQEALQMNSKISLWKVSYAEDILAETHRTSP